MPYKWENRNIKLKRKDDRRVKITEAHKKEIKRLHKNGIAIREISRRFENVCSRKAIQFILFPERLEIAKAQYKERRLDGRYYNKEKHTKAMASLRKHKQELYKKGELEYSKI